jgi:hypothetical protein
MGQLTLPQLCDDVEWERARHVVQQFIKKYGVPVNHFEKLAKWKKVFVGLNRRRFFEPPGERGKNSSARRRMLVLAEMADQTPAELLRRLGLEDRLDDPATIVAGLPAEAGTFAFIFDGNPLQSSAAAIKLAAMGHAKTAFQILLSGFALQSLRIDQAMHLLPALIYVGYRYLSPVQFIAGIDRGVLPFLKTPKPRQLCEPHLQSLCLAQMACALNEGGDKPWAGLLFENRNVKKIIHDGDRSQLSWPRQQLLRNASIYWSILGENCPKALDYASRARLLKQNDPGNERAVANVSCTAHIQAKNYAAAWEASEKFYWASRNEVLEAANQNRIHQPDLPHHLSSLINGAQARFLAGEKTNRTDIDEEKMALNYCLAKLGRNVGPYRLSQPSLSLYPKHLLTAIGDCERPTLQTSQLDSLQTLVELLL